MVESTSQNTITDVNCGGVGGYGLIDGHEAGMLVLVRWLEVGRRLTGNANNENPPNTWGKIWEIRWPLLGLTWMNQFFSCGTI